MENIKKLTLQNGLKYPSDQELLMMILGTDSGEKSVEHLSLEVLKKTLSSNAENLVQELLSVKGMDESRVLQVAAALEFGRRRSSFYNARIKNPQDVIPFVKSYSLLPQEQFLSISLSGCNEILEIRVVTTGTLNKTIVHPREIFSGAIEKKAAAIIICHNHPSGSVEPSEDDVLTTARLLEASEIIGIQLLDHIIFSQNSYFSFIENNLVFTEEMN